MRRKIANIYDMAMKMGAPVIGMIDCAGLRLQEATDALDAFGKLYTKQALASGVIPQITAIFGTCGGGLSVVPALSDFTFMEAEKGKLFVNSPNAVAGNEISRCDTSSAKFQSEKAGLVDVRDRRRDSCRYPFSAYRVLSNNEDDASYEACEDDLNRVCADLANAAEDTAIALAEISDDHIFFETKRDFAKDMVTGFIKLNGLTVGAVANRSKVYNEEAEVVAKLTNLNC